MLLYDLMIYRQKNAVLSPNNRCLFISCAHELMPATGKYFYSQQIETGQQILIKNNKRRTFLPSNKIPRKYRDAGMIIF
jgi:hypothetical protein